MLVLLTYTDDIGRRCRLTTDGDAWMRQQRRHGSWQTMERHPVEDVDAPLGVKTIEQVPA